ncbi:MAG: cryptochrome/photolyase family protein [Actinobacteria bacterium]|nr:cryptochrome/photolyase family protein [Actinomycetota bacterium]
MQLLFADQLGPHFDLGGEILLPEVLSQFSKRRYHRQKAHLILYAIRARAIDARVKLLSLQSYRELSSAQVSKAIAPTSRPMLALARRLELELLPTRGFCSSREEFAASKGKGYLLETFYRNQRRRLNVLMDGAEPAGGEWNFDHENRKPVPKQGIGLRHFEVVENDLDREVRATLSELERSGKASFIGSDGPRKFAGSRTEALGALEHFIEWQLPLFGPYEDAVHDQEWVLAHSMLSAPMNLGLLDPMEVVAAVEAAYREGKASIQSVEGFIRQIIGWRDYVWHLYWEFGEEYLDSNYLDAKESLPTWLRELNASAIESNCLSHSVKSVATNAWAHHIQRLMILGNFALQRGLDPKAMNDWFIDAFVDGTPWVMPANVIGMSLFADGGRMSTKPYAAGGSYINKMTNLCSGCRFDPKLRVGENACPMTAGYWNFLHRNQTLLNKNPRMNQVFAGLRKLGDLPELVEQERQRDSF